MQNIISFVAIALTISFFTSCTTVEQREPTTQSTTTTTEQPTFTRPLLRTTETQTTRTY